MIVVRLEAKKELADVAEKLSHLGYETVTANSGSVFVYRKDSNTTQFTNDLKSAMSATKFSGQIKCEYGSGSITR